MVDSIKRGTASMLAVTFGYRHFAFMITRLLLAFALLSASLRAAETAVRFDLQADLDALPATGGSVRIPAGTFDLQRL
jgi:hypothetical protein